MLSNTFIIVISILQAGALVGAIVDSNIPVALMMTGFILSNIGILLRG